jgi:hypothetical protein
MSSSKRTRIEQPLAAIAPFRPGVSQAVLTHLLSFLPLRDVAVGQRVCRAWRAIPNYHIPLVTDDDLDRLNKAKNVDRFVQYTTTLRGSQLSSAWFILTEELSSVTTVHLSSDLATDLSDEDDFVLRRLCMSSKLTELRVVMPNRHQSIGKRLSLHHIPWFTRFAPTSRLQHLHMEGPFIVHQWNEPAFVAFMRWLPTSLVDLRLGPCFVTRPILALLLEQCPLLHSMRLRFESDTFTIRMFMAPEDWAVLRGRTWHHLEFQLGRNVELGHFSFHKVATLHQFAALQVTHTLRVKKTSRTFDGWKDAAVWQAFVINGVPSTLRCFEWAYPEGDEPDTAGMGPVTFSEAVVVSLRHAFPNLIECPSFELVTNSPLARKLTI